MTNFKRLTTHDEGDVVVVRFVDGELSDLLVQSQLQSELIELLTSRQPTKLMIDFGPVRYCTSATINGLLDVRKRMAKAGGKLRLCGLSKHVREAFRVLNLEGTIFQIDDSPSQSLAQLKAVPATDAPAGAAPASDGK